MAEKERILIVDDEESVREMVYKIVNQIGYEAVTAKNGREALEILRDTPSSIMITDIKMPEMDGLELIKSTRAEFPDTHIICMTSYGTSYPYTDLVALGAADYITKPFTVDDMIAKLNRVIRERNLVGDLTHKSL
jgi:YesN/AraC family two-component response regulator